MEFKNQFKLVTLIFFCTVLHFTSISQNRKYFVINGKVIAQSMHVENGTIEILKNDKQTFRTQVESHGRFRLELEYNSKYTLVFNQKDHQSKTVVVDTAAPVEMLNRPENFPNFKMAINLFEGSDEGNKAVYFVSYSENNQCFWKIPSESDIDFVNGEETNLTQISQRKDQKSKSIQYHIF